MKERYKFYSFKPFNPSCSPKEADATELCNDINTFINDTIEKEKSEFIGFQTLWIGDPPKPYNLAVFGNK